MSDAADRVIKQYIERTSSGSSTTDFSGFFFYLFFEECVLCLLLLCAASLNREGRAGLLLGTCMGDDC